MKNMSEAQMGIRKNGIICSRYITMRRSMSPVTALQAIFETLIGEVDGGYRRSELI
jgi:hypothetical protein